MPTFHYTVDDQEQQTEENHLTPRAILTNAGFDPTQRYLIRIEGKNQESYKDKLDEAVPVQNKKFITASLGGTGVS
jgi:hypothetical protein